MVEEGRGDWIFMRNDPRALASRWDAPKFSSHGAKNHYSLSALTDRRPFYAITQYERRRNHSAASAIPNTECSSGGRVGCVTHQKTTVPSEIEDPGIRGQP